ncbi:FtsH protease activity modulator HflK [Pontivivens insulae]|uniref:Protein HflK n=1 Tax=Pontivivens insulae TaxID=1639689 RepID=A0A2R8AFS2_9RHOB|nr:FtsH protease activity modulator HflK [Pontivivens insulae]RED12313.1 protease FtsH subunit HflK [Pontivivens insulae]SPF31069.1 Modulator of FtsH protease HflK [Pontivivens insulae]
MPYNDNSGGPWGGGNKGGNKGSGDGDRNPWGGGNRPNNGGGNNGQGPNNPVPDFDEIVRKGGERLKVLVGGGGGGGGMGRGPGGGDGGGEVPFKLIGLAAAAAAFLFWGFNSIYTVQEQERSVELVLGEFSSIGGPGLNFAPWPIVTHEIVPTTQERTEEIGTGGRSGRGDDGLMLTGDENIVDIDFQVVWNIANPADYLFNLASPEETISAVAESAMREVISRSELAPILNRDRAIISAEVQDLIQATLDSYDSGVNIVRLNFDRADPPNEVIDAFRDVQAAEQERATEQNRGDLYANRTLAAARGEAAQLQEQAEAYRSRVVNEALGEASRFLAVLEEYRGAEEVTRRRLYIETIEQVLSDVDMIILDQNMGEGGSGQGVVPYLPLNELRRGGNN